MGEEAYFPDKLKRALLLSVLRFALSMENHAWLKCFSFLSRVDSMRASTSQKKMLWSQNALTLLQDHANARYIRVSCLSPS